MTKNAAGYSDFYSYNFGLVKADELQETHEKYIKAMRELNATCFYLPMETIYTDDALWHMRSWQDIGPELLCVTRLPKLFAFSYISYVGTVIARQKSYPEIYGKDLIHNYDDDLALLLQQWPKKYSMDAFRDESIHEIEAGNNNMRKFFAAVAVNGGAIFKRHLSMYRKHIHKYELEVIL